VAGRCGSCLNDCETSMSRKDAQLTRMAATKPSSMCGRDTVRNLGVTRLCGMAASPGAQLPRGPDEGAVRHRSSHFQQAMRLFWRPTHLLGRPIWRWSSHRTVPRLTQSMTPSGHVIDAHGKMKPIQNVEGLKPLKLPSTERCSPYVDAPSGLACSFGQIVRRPLMRRLA
jgi:hypothetical protein